jgi:hypothetical protein
MTKNTLPTALAARTAIVTLAEIASALQAFNSGETNAYETLDDITTCIDAYRTIARAQTEAA